MPPRIGGDEGLQAGHHAHQRIDGRIVQRVEDAAGGGERRAESEGEGDHDVVVHADQLRGLGIERHGAHRGADLRAIDDELQREHQQHGDDDDGELVGRDDERAELEVVRTGKSAGNVRGAAPKKTWPLYSSSRDTPMAVMRTLSVGRAAQRPVGEPFDRSCRAARSRPSPRAARAGRPKSSPPARAGPRSSR